MQSVKLNSPHMNIICMINKDTLYEKALKESIPFFKVLNIITLMNSYSGMNGLRPQLTRRFSLRLSRTRNLLQVNRTLRKRQKRQHSRWQQSKNKRRRQRKNSYWKCKQQLKMKLKQDFSHNKKLQLLKRRAKRETPQHQIQLKLRWRRRRQKSKLLAIHLYSLENERTINTHIFTYTI